MKQQLTTMLQLQGEMNTKVHSEWQEQEFEWYRAIWVECAELLDHYGWKWWKKQTPDVDQIALELVDIWHFGLSLLLLKSQSVDDIANQISAARVGFGIQAEMKIGKHGRAEMGLNVVAEGFTGYFSQ